MEQTTQLQSAKMISTCTVVGSLSCVGNSLILTPAFSNILPKAEVPGGVQFGFRFSVFGEREGPLGRARLLPSRRSVPSFQFPDFSFQCRPPREGEAPAEPQLCAYRNRTGARWSRVGGRGARGSCHLVQLGAMRWNLKVRACGLTSAAVGCRGYAADRWGHG